LPQGRVLPGNDPVPNSDKAIAEQFARGNRHDGFGSALADRPVGENRLAGNAITIFLVIVRLSRR